MVACGQMCPGAGANSERQIRPTLCRLPPIGDIQDLPARLRMLRWRPSAWLVLAFAFAALFLVMAVVDDRTCGSIANGFKCGDGVYKTPVRIDD